MLAALSLVMMVSSIFVADVDGTFATVFARHDLLGDLRPVILTLQGVVGALAIAGLGCAALQQCARRAVPPLTLMNSVNAYGLISRYAHWVIAVLMLVLIPIGLFMSVLTADAPDRMSFVLAHQSLGLLVLVLVILRLGWLLQSPPPRLGGDLRGWERHAAHYVHIALYGLILAFPLTGFLMTMWQGGAIQFFGLPIPALFAPDERLAALMEIFHGGVLPYLFYAAIAAHIGAVLKHHFIDHHRNAVRRMLR